MFEVLCFSVPLFLLIRGLGWRVMEMDEETVLRNKLNRWRLYIRYSHRGEYYVSVAAPCSAYESCAFPFLTSICRHPSWSRRKPDRMGIDWRAYLGTACSNITKGLTFFFFFFSLHFLGVGIGGKKNNMPGLAKYFSWALWRPPYSSLHDGMFLNIEHRAWIQEQRVEHAYCDIILWQLAQHYCITLLASMT